VTLLPAPVTALMSASTPFDGLKIAPKAPLVDNEEAPIAAAKEPRTNPRRFMSVSPSA